MRLRAQILIDIEAASFSEAAEHQRRVELAFQAVLGAYPDAQLEFRQRRSRVRPANSNYPRALHPTGRMSVYNE